MHVFFRLGNFRFSMDHYADSPVPGAPDEQDYAKLNRRYEWQARLQKRLGE
jgi:hypothetical protein